MNKVIVHIKDGKIQNPKIVAKAFKLADGRYEMSLKKANRRSLQQNSFYWAAVVPLVHEGLRDLGHEVSMQETHEFLKARFNYKEVINEVSGEVLQIPLSTTDLNKEQFGIYIDRITQFASEFLNVTIPPPGQPMLIAYE